MAITINQDQRDALWSDIQLDLSGGLDDLRTCIKWGNVEQAREFRHRLERHFRMLDDLGWARADVRDEFTLTMPPAELEEAIRWHHVRCGETARERAADLQTVAQGDLPAETTLAEFQEQTREMLDEDLDIVNACNHVLGQLEETS